jgi:hypothetical protein
MRMRNAAHWRIHPRLYNKCFGVQIGQICVEFVSTIGRIDRGTCGTSRHSEKGHRHFWPIREDQGYPVMTFHTCDTQGLHYLINVPV